MSNKDVIYHVGNCCNQCNDPYLSFVCFAFGLYGLDAGHPLAPSLLTFEYVNSVGGQSEEICVCVVPRLVCPEISESLAL